MNDNPADTPADVPAGDAHPVKGPEPVVGPVNATFEPIAADKPAAAKPEAAPEPVPPSPAPDEGNAPPPLETTPAPSGNSTLLGCLRDVLLVLVSLVLGAAFALVILLGLNGTLFLNDREKTAALEVSQQTMQTRQDRMEDALAAQKGAIATTQAQVQSLDGQLQTLSDDQQKQAGEITALQTRSDEIEQATETNRQGVEAVREGQKALTGQIGALDQRVGDLEDRVDGMEQDIADVKQTAVRFDRFVAGLVKLMTEVASDEVKASETVTSTVPAATPTVPPVTETAPAVTPAPSATPAPEAGAPSALEIFPPRAPLPTPAAGAGIIYGVVWLDANGNGAPDTGEVALPGVRVVLKTPGGQALLTMVTGVDGHYAFINMPPGRYQLAVIPPKDRGYALPPVQTITVDADQSVEVNFGLTQP